MIESRKRCPIRKERRPIRKDDFGNSFCRSQSEGLSYTPGVYKNFQDFEEGRADRSEFGLPSVTELFVVVVTANMMAEGLCGLDLYCMG